MPNPDLSGRKILVSVLNWGLGHASRSIPLIRQLVDWNAEVLLGGDGRSLHLLRQEFPGLESADLPSYNVRYTSGKAMVPMTIALIPNYLLAINKEHRVLEKLIKERGIDLVISDNRYGMWSDKVPSVFICHQISVIPPEILGWSKPVLYRLHRLFMDRYDAIWIPDFEGPENLSGDLSHSFPATSKMRYLGPLSRFKAKSQAEAVNGNTVLIVLSGPEPQRSILERKIISEARTIDRSFVLVQGRTEVKSEEEQGNIRIVSYMNAEELEHEMAAADVVVARSGYSTVMDLHTLGKRAVLIPTPGQTEQVYLANRLARGGMAVIRHQDRLDLKGALEEVDGINGFATAVSNPELYRKVMIEFFRSHGLDHQKFNSSSSTSEP